MYWLDIRPGLATGYVNPDGVGRFHVGQDAFIYAFNDTSVRMRPGDRVVLKKQPMTFRWLAELE